MKRLNKNKKIVPVEKLKPSKILLNRIKREGKKRLIVKEIPQIDHKSTTDPWEAVEGFEYITFIDCKCCGKYHEITGIKLPQPVRNVRGVLCTYRYECLETGHTDYFHLGSQYDAPLP